MKNEKETAVDSTRNKNDITAENVNENSISTPSEIDSNFDLSALTAKNSDYVHSVTRGLLIEGKTDEQVKEILSEIVPQILEAQKTGITARNLLGTPTEFIEQYKPKIGSKNVKETNKDPKLMILDSILLLLALLSALYGIMMFINNNSGVTYGITTIVLSAITGGLALYQVYRVQLAITTRKEKTKGFARFKPSILLAVYAIIWIFVTSLGALIPLAFNPVLGGIPYVAIAVIAFGIRYLLKRRYNIQSAMVPRNQLK